MTGWEETEMMYKTLERQLVAHCAPTLASLKTANLFSYQYASDKKLFEAVNFWNRCMEEKGISLAVLRKNKGKALIYVYRTSQLKKDLSREEAVRFMKECGYSNTETDLAIRALIRKLHKNPEFPHEIGMFLGYPLEDVIGFIQNEGHNSKCIGYWKVYGDETTAKRTFAKFNKCRDVYMRLWNQGRSVLQLTVAA